MSNVSKTDVFDKQRRRVVHEKVMGMQPNEVKSVYRDLCTRDKRNEQPRCKEWRFADIPHIKEKMEELEYGKKDER